MSGFCPNCRTPRTGALRYCRSCGLDFEAAAPTAPTVPQPVPTSAKVASWVVFAGALVVIAGLVWIWANTATDDLAVHIFLEVVFGTFWLGFLWVVVGILGFIGVLGAALTIPFWRKR